MKSALTIFLALGFLIHSTVLAQGVSINTDGSDPDGSAMLDIQSISKGLLIPRMDFAQMFGIVNPAEGLMVYCTTFNSFYYYSNSIWNKLSGGEDDDWTIDGNDMYSNNAGLVSIGMSTTLPTHKLTIENNSNNNLLRLIGTGSYGEYAKLNFGDGDYAYIQEFWDDKLMMYGGSGLALVSNFNIEMQSGYGIMKIYMPQGNVSIKDDQTDGDPSAILDVNSSNKGMLIPRLTTDQILTIDNPANGLQVFNTTDGKLYIFVTAANCWKEVSYGSGTIYLQTFENCGDDLIDTRDGQSYATVDINGQCWMAENLNYGNMVPTGASQVNNGTVEKYCLNNSPSYCDNLGGLYQWNEMMNYNSTPGSQGICPTGWHVPTDAEWFAMENFLDPSISNPTQTGWRGTNAGQKLKNSGSGPPFNWSSGNAGTNESGFTALPSGYRNSSGQSAGIGTNAAFWTSTQLYDRELYYLSNSVFRVNTGNPYFGFAVRCIKD